MCATSSPDLATPYDKPERLYPDGMIVRLLTDPVALERTSFTPQQMDDIQEFARRVGKGLDKVVGHPEHQRQFVDALDVGVGFAVEAGKKVIHAQCALADEPEKFGISSISTPSPCPTRSSAAGDGLPSPPSRPPCP